MTFHFSTGRPKDAPPGQPCSICARARRSFNCPGGARKFDEVRQVWVMATRQGGRFKKKTAPRGIQPAQGGGHYCHQTRKTTMRLIDRGARFARRTTLLIGTANGRWRSAFSQEDARSMGAGATFGRQRNRARRRADYVVGMVVAPYRHGPAHGVRRMAFGIKTHAVRTARPKSPRTAGKTVEGHAAEASRPLVQTAAELIEETPGRLTNLRRPVKERDVVPPPAPRGQRGREEHQDQASATAKWSTSRPSHDERRSPDGHRRRDHSAHPGRGRFRPHRPATTQGGCASSASMTADKTRLTGPRSARGRLKKRIALSFLTGSRQMNITMIGTGYGRPS